MVDRINFSDVAFSVSKFSGYFYKEMASNDLLAKTGALYKDSSLNKYALTSSATTILYDAYTPAEGNTVNYDATLTPATRAVAQTMIVIGRKYSFATCELADYLTLGNPELEVAKFVAKYWLKERNKSLIKVLSGAMTSSGVTGLVDNIATAGTITDSNRLTASNLTTSIQSKWGSKFKPAVLTVHSMVYKYLLGQNLISYLRINDLNYNMPAFMGIPVYVDDIHTSSTNSTYTSFLLGTKSIVTADAYEQIPFAIVDDGSVSGRQHLIQKQRYIRQPYGMSFNSTSLAGTSPTDGELATSTNWTLSYNSEVYVPVIKIISNV